MKILPSLALFAAVSLCSTALFASPSDAVAVTQSCGTPVLDTIAPSPANDPSPERILHYRATNLHFQEDGGGWNFLYATAPGSSRRYDRAQTAQLLPCFQQAMESVRLYSPAAQPTQQVPAAAPTFTQWLMQPVHGIRRAGYLPLLLLYILPTLIAWYRGTSQLRTVAVIDLLLGWTVIGWGYSLLLSLQDSEDVSDFDIGSMPLVYEDEARSDGTLRLHLVDRRAAEELPVEAEAEPYLRPAARRVEPIVIPEPIRSAQPLRPQLSPEPVTPPASTRVPEPIVPGRPFPFPATQRSLSSAPLIHWTEQFSPPRICRVELSAPDRQVIAYEMELTQRGFDDDGREYLGGYSRRTFHAFPMEKILNIRDFAA